MNDLGLVYLARSKSGAEPFHRFLDSYRRHAPGAEHDLLIVFKGFRAQAEIQQWLAWSEEFKPQFLMVSDHGFDLRAYGLAARRFPYTFFCFLNTFSEILSENWLAKMFTFIRQDTVGLVGATASYESMYTNVLLQRVQQPNPSFLRRVWTPLRLRFCRFCFDPLPNYHIRSNAFMISRQLMLRIWPRWFPTKRAAYLFENGKNSLTKRVLRLGLGAVVVGKDGVGYSQEEWHRSNTFRQGRQENLLVADNQTRQYLTADAQKQSFLSLAAWGERAQPLTGKT